MLLSRLKYLLLVCLATTAVCATAQPFSTIDLKNFKPEEYRRKVFRSEKTTTDQLNKFSLFLQNTYSYYNFLFNANTQMQAILQEAKNNRKDDYTTLLSFYPYDVNALAGNKYLDTVVEKATTGILMHDLRSKWVDELYFVLGNAYFFQQKYDSAHAVYQYINYAFSPRDDGYFVPIGSNVSASADVFSIVTRENKKSLLSRFTAVPKRNDTFLWQIRNMIDSGDAVQAGSYIQLLRQDVYLPERLKPYFNEIQAYYYYKQQRWDSAAFYLSATFNIESGNALKARKYYLTAQLYQLADSLQLANTYYANAIDKTIDPQLELNARLSMAALAARQNILPQYKSLDAFTAMIHKEKFFAYRDILYYEMAMQMLQNGDRQAAREAITKSIYYNKGNPAQRSKSFAMLAGLYYADNDFKQAAFYMDSISFISSLNSQDSAWVAGLKQPLLNVKSNYTIITRADSILRIANLPEVEKLAFLDKEARRIRKLVARKENENQVVNMGNTGNVINQQSAVDIFASVNAAGEWYFNDVNALQMGYAAFIQRYGNRKNEDQWIRSARKKNVTDTATPSRNMENAAVVQASFDSTFVTGQDLLLLLPATQEEKQVFSDSVTNVLLQTGKIFQNEIMDFNAALQYYRDVIRHAPQSLLMPEVLYNLYLSSHLSRNKTLADSAKNALLNHYGGSSWALLVSKPSPPSIARSSIQNDTTKMYDAIYQQFLEGHYAQAVAAKTAADKVFGTHYWTPQLLYIEALYYVTRREDSIALQSLQAIKTLFATSTMTEKADILINVLQRRQEIEKYLTQLQIQPYRSDKKPVIAKTSFKKEVTEITEPWRGVATDVINILDTQGNPIPKFPTSLEEKLKQAQQTSDTLANNDNVYTSIARPPLNQDNPAINDTLSTTHIAPSNNTEVAIIDTPKTPGNPFEPPVKKPLQQKSNTTGFGYEKLAPAYAMILLDNIDQVYLNEVGNAFNRYNIIMFEGIQIEVQSKNVGERYNLVLLGPFRNSQEANGYIRTISPDVATTIVPWLAKDKYLFNVINKTDLDKIHNSSDLEKYIINQR